MEKKLILIDYQCHTNKYINNEKISLHILTISTHKDPHAWESEKAFQRE